MGGELFFSVAFSPDEKTIAASLHSQEQIVSIWDAKTFKKLHDCTGLDRTSIPEHPVLYSPDGKLVISVALPFLEKEPDPAKIFIWEVATGKLLYQFRSQGIGTQIALSRDGRWLVHNGGGTPRFWDFEKIRREIGK
ncbi:MAG: hypothetical protein EXR98_04325 [Gemmataceae bacterium]|nr:hypothetical protein [Gemmataceae bacterium]